MAPDASLGDAQLMERVQRLELTASAAATLIAPSPLPFSAQGPSQHSGAPTILEQAGKSNSNSPPTSRPQNLRRATDPITPLGGGSSVQHLRPAAPVLGHSRNRSPYSRSHLRSRSSNSMSSFPMQRAYSSPLADTNSSGVSLLPEQQQQRQFYSSSQGRPVSPMGSIGAPFARRSSPRRQLDEAYAHSSPLDVATPSVPTIEENAELSLPSPTPTIPEDGEAGLNSFPPPISLLPGHSTSFSIPRSRSRRRPSSPLYQQQQPIRTTSPNSHRMLHTSASVPVMSSVAVSRYNEAFPSSQPGSASAATTGSSASSMYSLSMSSSTTASYSGSMPSTPTSLRSRSPSINSLETIPDSPDAEEAAVERERQDRLERLERLEKLRNVIGTRDSEEPGKRMLGGGAGGIGVGAGTSAFGSVGGGGVGGAKERKRWSVCGAERRGDLEMETIWED